MNIDDLHHLDDPDGFIPDDEFRAGSRDRGRRLTRRRRAVLGAAGVATAMVLVVGAFGGYQKWRSSQIVRVEVAANLDPPVVVADPGDDDVPPAPTQALNILVVGSDAAMPGEGREFVTDVRTDTMMVVRADPDASTIGVLSLPRDLWVDIPDHGPERLNTAWETGGPALLIDTIKANLDIPINHFMQVDGEGFQRIVDQAGGTSLWVAGELADRNTGFAAAGPGCVQLDGTQALALVRSRYLQLNSPTQGWVSDPTSDFGRIGRQQVMGRVLAASLLDQELSVGSADDLLGILIDNAAIDDTWALRDMAGLLLWAQDLDLDSDLLLATPPANGGYAGQASVLYLDEAAAQPILDRFRPGPAAPAEAPAADPGSAPGITTSLAPEPTTTTTSTTLAPGATPDADEWVQATAPDGAPCP